MNNKSRQSWENFLNPEIMRPRLIVASLYLWSFEILKDAIIDRIRNFFCNGFNQNGDIIDPGYQAEVLSLNRSRLYASLQWLQSMKVIDQKDLDIFGRIKSCRNTLAHDLPHLGAGAGLPGDFENNFQEMASLIRKIEIWWITNVEIPINPDYAGHIIDESGIIPGPLLSLQILCDVALGPNDQSRFYYEQFRKKVSEPPAPEAK